MEKELKEIITTKTNNLLQKGTEGSFMAIKNFNEISKKELNNFLMFYHSGFKNVKLTNSEKPIFLQRGRKHRFPNI
jgi:hypothetical protein